MCKLGRVSCVIFVGLCSVLPSIGFSQTFSPYSALGIGDLYIPAQAHQMGTGGLGISNSSVFFQNTTNPALLVDNGIYTFAAGFSGVNKNILQNDNREQFSSGNLTYINMILPISQGNVTLGFGLTPYSDANYNFQTSTPVEGDPDADMVAFDKGEGGFNQLAITGGVRITDNILLGLKAAYIFSSIENEVSSVLSDPMGRYVPSSTSRTTASDFMFGGGAVYRKTFASNLKLSVGGTVDVGKDLGVKRSQVVVVSAAGSFPISIDTLFNETEGAITLPTNYGVGISIGKANKWMIGTDFRMQQWNDYRNFFGENDFLVDARLLSVGGEITPVFNSVDNYFARVTYRLGFNFNETPYFVADTQIREFGINFGLSLPVASFSSVDLGFKYGTRGTLDNNLIQENFFQVFFGVTFNDNRWFIRPKFN